MWRLLSDHKRTVKSQQSHESTTWKSYWTFGLPSWSELRGVLIHDEVKKTLLEKDLKKIEDGV